MIGRMYGISANWKSRSLKKYTHSPDSFTVELFFGSNAEFLDLTSWCYVCTYYSGWKCEFNSERMCRSHKNNWFWYPRRLWRCPLNWCCDDSISFWPGVFIQWLPVAIFEQNNSGDSRCVAKKSSSSSVSDIWIITDSCDLCAEFLSPRSNDVSVPARHSCG